MSVVRPTLAVVTGPAGAGSTTLAHALARLIPCPAVCRDEIKEGMVHALAAPFEPAAADPLTVRTFGVFFDVLRTLVEAEVSVVAEAAFQDRLWRHGLEPLVPLVELRIVHCHVSAAVAYERAVRRGPRAAHVGPSPELADWERSIASFVRVSLDAPALDVDTTAGYSPTIDEVVAFVNRR